MKENKEWEDEFWKVEKKYNLSLDNENYQDLMDFARFYQNKGRFESSFGRLKDIVDDSVTEITVETPDGWKCDRKGCTADYRHSHGTYPSLSPTPPTQENELDLDTWFEGRDEQMVNAHIELLKKIVGMSQDKEKPTQEKELCEHCGEPLPFKPIQEIGSKGGWAGGIGIMIPKEEKGLTYDEAIYLGKAMSEKLTQDTESWEDKMVSELRGKLVPDTAPLIGMLRQSLRQARTQGAEAAVGCFIENKYLFVEGKEFYETSFERVCERAKKV